MPNYGLPDLDHGCCRARFMRRRPCACVCHDLRVTDYSMRAPARDDYGRMQLIWGVYQHGGQNVGMVREQMPGEHEGHGYAAMPGRGGVLSRAVVRAGWLGPLAVVEDPWDAVMILAAWTLTSGTDNWK